MIPEKQSKVRAQLDEALRQLADISPKAEMIATQMLAVIVNDLKSCHNFESARFHHWEEYLSRKSRTSEPPFTAYSQDRQ